LAGRSDRIHTKLTGNSDNSRRPRLRPRASEKSSLRSGLFNSPSVPTFRPVPLTSNLRWADAPGNVLLTATVTGLPKDSVANVSQVVTLDKLLLTERVGKLSASKLELLLSGLDVILGR